MKVLVKAPFSMYSGYGTDGWGILRALKNFGIDVYPQPTWLDVPIPADLAPLFGKTLEGPFDLTINHWDPEHLEVATYAREMTRCLVGWTMWEFAGGPGKVRKDGRQVPVSGLVPHCPRRGSLKDRLKLYDLVLGYDQVSADAMSFYMPEHVPLAILQGGYESADWQGREFERDWYTEDDFRFIMHGSMNARKCPWTVIQAWSMLKADVPEFAPAKLMLHTTSPSMFMEMNDILSEQKVRVYLEPWTHAKLKSFYMSAHCLVAPSRGEGKNLPALEMMTTGGVVAATAFGGHMQWLNPSYAYPLDFQLTPTWPGRPDGAHDAKVSNEHLAGCMLHIFRNRAEAREKGELAAQVIPKMCDWNVVIEKLFERIRDNVEFNGQLIYNMAMEARREKASTSPQAPVRALESDEPGAFALAPGLDMSVMLPSNEGAV